MAPQDNRRASHAADRAGDLGWHLARKISPATCSRAAIVLAVLLQFALPLAEILVLPMPLAGFTFFSSQIILWA
jgi:hypothetical protein